MLDFIMISSFMPFLVVFSPLKPEVLFLTTHSLGFERCPHLLLLAGGLVANVATGTALILHRKDAPAAMMIVMEIQLRK